MTFLSSARHSRIRVLLAILAEGGREIEEIGRMNDQIRLDYHGRFLIELVQNAVDPALKAGVRQARILIVRTETVLAVLNQGAAFDADGLTSIISLALSAKKPDEAIGNKGVGFKSVFEVAEAAEVFGVGADQTNLKAEPALRMRLSRGDAAAQPGLLGEALHLLGEDAALSQKFAAKHAGVDAVIERALALSPAWRFPEELALADWKRAVADLGLSAKDLGAFQTAIVLRLAPTAAATVEAAIREFTGNAQEVHLFLPGVERIEIRDPAGDVLLERADIKTDDARGLVVRRLRSRVGEGPVAESLFWLATGVLSGPALEAAVAALPGEGWQAVRRAEVQVALPIPVGEESLPPDGRYYVGLPTRTASGSPFRVDARFHATLSRTGLDLASNAYNVLLNRHAAEVAASLLRALRTAPPKAPVLVDRVRARRAVTLSLAAGPSGTFAGAVRGQVAGDPTVLLQDGETFAAPGSARRVADSDADVVSLCETTAGADSLPFAGIQLVDRHVEATADALLADLGVPKLKASELLARRDGLSILERVAAALPRDNATGWAILLPWLAALGAGAGSDQRLLPTAGGGLVTPTDRPFTPLIASGGSGELSSGDVPDSLLADLTFLDPGLLAGDDDLRRVLVEGQTPLARRPLAADVIRLAVLPALARAVAAGDEVHARELLDLALGLLGHVAATEPVREFPWLVPCRDGWLPAEDAYIGDDWDAERKADAAPGIVERVYRAQGRCVAAWWGTASERAAVRTALMRAGVDDSPRIWAYEPTANAIWGDYRQGSPQPVPPPGVVPPAIWAGWVREIAATTNVDWGPRTWWTLDAVEWVDGLERPETCLEVAGWALTQKADSAKLLPVAPQRYKNGAYVQQLWVFALRCITTPFVPSHPGCTLSGRPARPAELCRVGAERNVVAWLPRAADGLNAEVLAAVGVKALTEMPAAWLVEQLSTFATALDPQKRNGVLARGMWTLLNSRARSEVLPDMTGLVLPVWRKGEVVAVAGSAIPGLTIVDDAYAAEVLGDALDGTLLLEPEGESWNPLIERLRTSLPGTTIELVSRLSYPYSVVEGVEITPLLAILTRTVGENAVATIAALLRAQKTGVGVKDVDRAWASVAAAKVQLGVLPTSAPRAVWLPQVRVLVCQNIDGNELVASIWPIVGKAWRNELLALGTALSRGDRSLRDFMRHEGIGEEAVADATARLGLGPLLAPYGPPIRISPVAPPTAHPGVPTSSDDADEGDGQEIEPELGQIDLDAALDRLQRAPTPLALPGPSRAPPPRSRFEGTRSRSPHPSSAASDEYARQIGHLGEMFAFRALAAKLDGFDEGCWKSSSRALLGFAGGDDTLGYDFHYIDVTGALCGRPGAECFIEVKANARAMRPRCAVSRNEWNLATACHASTTQVFVIVRVAGIAEDATVAAIIVDPVQFVTDGAMSLSPKDGWWLDVGGAASMAAPSNGEAAYLAK